MGNKHLTATEAHKITIDSDCTLNRIYKFIDQMAKENYCTLVYDFYDTEPSVTRRILDDLRNNGYTVEQINETSCNEYRINW